MGGAAGWAGQRTGSGSLPRVDGHAAAPPRGKAATPCGLSEPVRAPRLQRDADNRAVSILPTLRLAGRAGPFAGLWLRLPICPGRASGCHLTTRLVGLDSMPRQRHPKPDVESALAHAEQHGWRIAVGGSHAWGKMYCPRNDTNCRCGEFCITSIWSTPRDAGTHGRQLRRVVDRCRHVMAEQVAGQTDESDE